MKNKIDNFLQLEEKEELYNYSYSFKNIMMYPVIRSFLLEQITEELYNFKYEDANIKSLFIKIKFVFKALFYRIPGKIKSDIIIFDTDLSNRKQDNKYFNFISEYFANEYPDKTVLIEGSHKLDFSRPRTYPKVYGHDFLLLKSLFKSKFKATNNKDIQKIDAFLQCLKKQLKEQFNFEFSNNNNWNKMRALLLRGLKRIPSLYNEHINLYKKMSPKVILVKNGCRGGYNKIPLIMAAKDLNIPIGEHTHGIPDYVVIYNYSPKLFNSYKYYLPDFFMTTGKSTLKMLNMPIKIYETGYPYLSEIIKKYNIKEKENILVYMSARYEPEMYIEEVLFLNKKLASAGISIQFRIHPQEIEKINTVYKPILDAGISIDSYLTKPIHDSLSRAKYVVSGGGTSALSEALAFGCNVFIKDSPLNNDFMNMSLFNVYKNKEEVSKIILNNKHIKNTTYNILTENWQKEYHKLIDSFL